MVCAYNFEDMPPVRRYSALLQLTTRPETARRLRRLADQEDTSVAAILRRLVERYLAERADEDRAERPTKSFAAG